MTRTKITLEELRALSKLWDAYAETALPDNARDQFILDGVESLMRKLDALPSEAKETSD